ncbi:MAG: primosomal protein N' [Gammaproteobacteria bacterium]|nr:MAG: primosomal protein N' [Gammaproteobacteria bacterium]
MTQAIYEIAVPTPLYRSFEYLAPEDGASAEIGSRVKVVFGNRNLVGVVIAIKDYSDFDISKLKPITEILDNRSLIKDETLRLAQWAIKYYQSYQGEILSLCFPTALRKGKEAAKKSEMVWVATDETPYFGRAKRQQEIYEIIARSSSGLLTSQLPAPKKDAAIIRQLAKRGAIKKQPIQICKQPETYKTDTIHDLQLNSEQQQAYDSICSNLNSYKAHLIFGITGSGKTEVFIQVIRQILQKGKQALILVPEIGLTPQLVKRFTDRFHEKIVTIHSEMSETEKLNSWLAAQDGAAKIVIGTRSALFTPFADLGLVIIDEEHDLSFKQQEGIRYSARDMAVTRAHMRNIPIVLCSATPSLESLNNASQGRYNLLQLTQRAGKAKQPNISIIDIRNQKLQGGMSHRFILKIKQHIESGGQTIIFLNRRGYAPVVMCHSCGWTAKCNNCDVRLTLYQNENTLRCQHCGYAVRTPQHCPDCKEKDITPLGKGTERIEEALKAIFPDTSIARIDRDTTTRKGSFNKLMQDAECGQIQILLGTQMLAKGHHLPNITLTGIVDIDSGLFSTDFRSIEKMAQLVTQVAGRSGRGEKAGEVILQTHHPDNPTLYRILFNGYQEFARLELQQRRKTLLPPFTSMAVIRAEALEKAAPKQFLDFVKEQLQTNEEINTEIQLEILGPIASSLHRRNRHYRVNLFLQSTQRNVLQETLEKLLSAISNNKLGKKVRWHIDMDPQETI